MQEDSTNEIDSQTSLLGDTGFNDETTAKTIITVSDEEDDQLFEDVPEENTTQVEQSTRLAKRIIASMTEIPCGEFVYRGDQATLGSRWEMWTERFDLYVAGNVLTDEAVIKARFLLLMGPDAMNIYRSKKKENNTDTLDEVKVFMKAHFVIPKSEYSEVMLFRQAFRKKGERVNEYAMRLRHLATHCKFKELEKEIERQFVVGCEMPEVQNKCSRTAVASLKEVLDMAVGFERVREAMSELKGSTIEERTVHYASTKTYNKPTQQPHNKSSWNYPTPCSKCGNEAHKIASECRAIGKACGNCLGLNHFRKVCPEPVREQRAFNNNGVQRGSQGGNTNYKNHGYNSQYSPAKSSQANQQSSQSRRVNFINEEATAQASGNEMNSKANHSQ